MKFSHSIFLLSQLLLLTGASGTKAEENQLEKRQGGYSWYYTWYSSGDHVYSSYTSFNYGVQTPVNKPAQTTRTKHFGNPTRFPTTTQYKSKSKSKSPNVDNRTYSIGLPKPEADQAAEETPSSSSEASPSPTVKAAAAADCTALDTASCEMQQITLEEHNAVRAEHHAPPLVWNQTLAEAEGNYVKGCNWGHSGGSLVSGGYGENIAMNTAKDADIRPMIQDWVNERDDYDYSSDRQDHFTQVVWKATTSVGCAIHFCDTLGNIGFGTGSFYSCAYYPQGNIVGQNQENVLPRR